MVPHPNAVIEKVHVQGGPSEVGSLRDIPNVEASHYLKWLSSTQLTDMGRKLRPELDLNQ